MFWGFSGICKTLLIAEQRFRQINAAELLLVAARIRYQNGKRIQYLCEEREKVVARPIFTHLLTEATGTFASVGAALF